MKKLLLILLCCVATFAPGDGWFATPTNSNADPNSGRTKKWTVIPPNPNGLDPSERGYKGFPTVKATSGADAIQKAKNSGYTGD